MSDSTTLTPVTILTGFLGSGKTTLLNALLRDPGFGDTAVIVNELGEIGLDNLLVEAVEENVVLLSSGCLCCGLMGSLRETLLDLDARRRRGDARFSRVMVETTGLADPAPIVQSMLRDTLITGTFAFEGLVTVVDALLGETTLHDHIEARRQASLADRLVLSKLDLAEPGGPDRLRDHLRRLNPLVDIAEGQGPASTQAQVLGGGDLLTRRPAPARDHHHDHPHAHHGSGVRADSFVVDGDIEWAGLAGWTDVVTRLFGARMLRCKGLLSVRGAAGPVLVQGVQTVFSPPQVLKAWPDADRRPRLVCISQGVDADEVRASLAVLRLDAGAHPPASMAEIMAMGRAAAAAAGTTV